MKVLVQRVKKASVEVDKKIVASIEKGLLVFLGVEKNDSQKQAEYLAEAAEASLYDTGIRPGEGDRVLTLYTCHGSGQRMVVHARLG